jgi:hypothetical protein
MGQRERYGGALTKHYETEHDETKTKAKEAEFMNIWQSQQAEAHCLDRKIEDRTLLTKRISQTIQHH